jgi:hypothetical protein
MSMIPTTLFAISWNHFAFSALVSQTFTDAIGRGQLRCLGAWLGLYIAIFTFFTISLLRHLFIQARRSSTSNHRTPSTAHPSVQRVLRLAIVTNVIGWPICVTSFLASPKINPNTIGAFEVLSVLAVFAANITPLVVFWKPMCVQHRAPFVHLCMCADVTTPPMQFRPIISGRWFRVLVVCGVLCSVLCLVSAPLSRCISLLLVMVMVMMMMLTTMMISVNLRRWLMLLVLVLVLVLVVVVIVIVDL